MVLFLFAYFNSNILYSVHLFCTRWSFAIDLFKCFFSQTFDYFWKHVTSKLLISLCWHILHQFRFCKVFPVINSLTIILLIETLYKFRPTKCWFTLYLHMCFRLLQIQSFFRFRLTFLCFKFHWYLHCSNINTFSTSQIGDILHFNKLFFLTFKFKCSSHSYLFLHGSGSSFDNHWWHQQRYH